MLTANFCTHLSRITYNSRSIWKKEKLDYIVKEKSTNKVIDIYELKRKKQQGNIRCPLYSDVLEERSLLLVHHRSGYVCVTCPLLSLKPWPRYRRGLPLDPQRPDQRRPPCSYALIQTGCSTPCRSRAWPSCKGSPGFGPLAKAGLELDVDFNLTWIQNARKFLKSIWTQCGKTQLNERDSKRNFPRCRPSC